MSNAQSANRLVNFVRMALQRTAKARLAYAVPAAAVLSLGATVTPTAHAEDTDELQTVTVTGSLIPQDKTVTVPTPTITITSDDIKAKGFTSIADVLQQSSVSTGSIQEGIANSFTPGAHVISMFGLDPSYTKFLIDGLPMGNYPALYNGTSLTGSISGIPSELIDHIDILPGGQSSIYGSDAIAGVVNIVMKKDFDAPVFDAKYGWDKGGGGSEKRFALADGITLGSLSLVGGIQYDKQAPVWDYQRNLTSSYNYGGLDPGIAARDWLVYGYYGQANGNTYYFGNDLTPPVNCNAVAGLYNGTVGPQSRPDHGLYCGSYEAGFETNAVGDEAVQGYFGGTLDLGTHVQLYANTLLGHDISSYSNGPGAYQTDIYPSDPSYYYYDPNTQDFMNLQHIISPEEAGGLGNSLSEDLTTSIRATVGAKGALWSPNWTYDVGFTYDQTKLVEHFHTLLTAPLEAYYNQILGPLTEDPVNGPSYSPNYPAFYEPITPAEYAAFSGFANNRSYTEDSLARAQLTDTDLFHLPGGNAAAAVVVEGGGEGWNYDADPQYGENQVYGIQTTAGTGHRSRYAGTMELRLPILSMLSLTASGRYDKYNVTDGDFSKFTYNLGLEYHPLEMLTVRGRYGTAFKAPTLADEFQGQSGFYVTETDYYQCSIAGYAGSTLSNCPSIYLNDSVQATTQGNAGLKPITATVWDAGLTLTPLSGLSLSADLMEWNINNEVTEQSIDTLLREDSACLLGTLDPTTPTCVEAVGAVQRNSEGVITVISDPKVNLSNERLTSVVTDARWVFPIGVTHWTFDLSWTDMLKHNFTQFPGDEPVDLLADPFESTEFKSKVNASLTLDVGHFGTTLYVNRWGQTPNYVSTLETTGYATPGANPLATYTVTNWTARYEVVPGLTLTATIDNVFNDMPPIDRSYPDYQIGPYNNLDYTVLGREYSIEATYKFKK